MRRGLVASIVMTVMLVACTVTEQPSPSSSGSGQAQPSSGAESSEPTTGGGRLVVALTPPSVDTLLPWLGGHSINIQNEPALETLIGIDPTTGDYIPQLATDWELADDGRSWTFNLQQGVEFHYDFGEFTSADVVKSWELLAGEDSISSNTQLWRDTVADVEAVGDYQVVFHLNDVFPDLDYFVSSAADLKMMSAAQFEAEGIDGMAERLAGTGPYRIVEFNLGESVLFEKAPEHTYRLPEVDFDEIEFLFVREDSTRLAMLVSDPPQAHMAVLPRDLLAEAVDGHGMAQAQSSIGATPLWTIIGGLHYMTGEEGGAGTSPWNEPGESGRLVRQALAKAVNRDAINEFILHGSGDPMWLFPFHPTEDGWSDRWESEFDEMYGYDPDAAQALLAEAGYPEGFPMRMFHTPALEGAPELPQVAEAIALDFGAIGIDVELVTGDFSVIRENYVNRTTGEYLIPLRTNLRPIQGQIRSQFSPHGNLHNYESDELYALYLELGETVDPERRNEIATEIGDHLYDNFASISLFYLPSLMAYNPDVVGNYTWSGKGASIWDDFASVEAAR